MASPLYRVIITATGNVGRLTFEATLPEDFNFEVSSDWDQPFLPGNSTFSNLITGAGIATLHKSLTSQVWSGSSPVTLTIPLVFGARHDAKTEVVDKVRDLMTLALPAESSGGALLPPGPKVEFPAGVTSLLSGAANYLGLAVAGSTIINVTIGNFLRFSRVIVLSVTPTFSSILDKRGYPMSATCEVQFQSSGTMSVSALRQVFR